MLLKNLLTVSILSEAYTVNNRKKRFLIFLITYIKNREMNFYVLFFEM